MKEFLSFIPVSLYTKSYSTMGEQIQEISDSSVLEANLKLSE